MSTCCAIQKKAIDERISPEERLVGESVGNLEMLHQEPHNRRLVMEDLGQGLGIRPHSLYKSSKVGSSIEPCPMGQGRAKEGGPVSGISPTLGLSDLVNDINPQILDDLGK